MLHSLLGNNDDIHIETVQVGSVGKLPENEAALSSSQTDGTQSSTEEERLRLKRTRTLKKITNIPITGRKNKMPHQKRSDILYKRSECGYNRLEQKQRPRLSA